MSFWRRLNDQEEKESIKPGTVFVCPDEMEIGREYFPSPRGRLVCRHLNCIDEIEIEQNFPHVFRPPGIYEFKTLRAATQFYINQLIDESRQTESPSIEGEILEKTPERCGDDLSQFIAGMEDEILINLSDALRRPGIWRETLVSSVESVEKAEHERQEKADLKNRLLDVFSSPLILWLFFQVKPEVFRRAIESLPPGQTEKDLMKDQQESLKRDRENRQGRIEEARAFLKKL